jgi:hypothetical protein
MARHGKPWQDTEEGALPTARSTTEGQLRSAGNLQVDAPQNQVSMEAIAHCDLADPGANKNSGNNDTKKPASVLQ